MAFNYNGNREESTAEPYVEPTKQDQGSEEKKDGDAIEETEEQKLAKQTEIDAALLAEQEKNKKEGEGSSGEGDAETEEQKTIRLAEEQKAEQTQVELKASIRREYLAELGFDSEESFKTAKAKIEAKPETEEEKAVRLANYDKELTAFAIKTGKISTKDISAIENLRNMEDQEILLRDFTAEYKETHKDRDKEDPVTPEEIQDAFNDLYHINSENPVLKGRGEKLMKETVAKIKDESESKLADAKAEYDIILDKHKNVPLYKGFVQANVKKFIPDHLVLSGEGDKAVIFQLKDDKGNPRYDIEEIEKLFVDDKLFDRFIQGKDLGALETVFKETIEDFLEKKNRPAIREFLIEQGKNVGRLEGSTTGAKAPFESKDVKPVVTSDKEMTADEQKMMANRHAKLTYR